MRSKLRMPDLSTTGEDVTIVKCLAEVGQAIKRGDSIIEIETDKAVMEVECAMSGTLVEYLAKPGEKVALGAFFAVLEVPTS